MHLQRDTKRTQICVLLHPSWFPPIQISVLECVAGATELAPATSCITGSRSNQPNSSPRKPSLPDHLIPRFQENGIVACGFSTPIVLSPRMMRTLPAGGELP